MTDSKRGDDVILTDLRAMQDVQHQHSDQCIDPRDVHRLLEALLRISNQVGSVMLLDDILDDIVRTTAELMRVPICSVYLIDEAGQRLVMRSNVGFEPELCGQASFAIGEGIPGWVASQGQTLALVDATADPRYMPLPSAMETDVKAYFCAPLRIQESVVGVMTLRRPDTYEFTHNDVLIMETICKQVAIVIEKARMYERQLQAERLAAVAVSLTGVAHYIKNVLQTMKGGEYLVQHGIEDQNFDSLREGWDVLKRANHKIRGLVENILNYCRAEKVSPRAVNLNETIREMLESIQRHAEERGTEVVAELQEDLPPVLVDPEGFYDMLLNLLGNGIDAIPEDRPGRVVVRTRQLQGRKQLVIEIEDNGCGIPEEYRDKIFNLFFSTKGRQGTGIGLAATKKVINDHGGTIEFETREGEGTTFRIFMPVAQPYQVAEQEA